MLEGSPPLVFAAHPGHELLIYGWLRRARPRVLILTDGSGYTAVPRIEASRRLLDSMDVPAGNLFGRFSDQEMYAGILGGDVDLITGIVREVANELEGASSVVADASEGYNSVHDLCRFIVGAACALAGGVEHYEYPVVQAPASFDVTFELDDAEWQEKLSAARNYSSIRNDTNELIGRFGEDAFRVESFRRVEDWGAPGWPAGEKPYYERIGEERVSGGRYGRVIRYAEHMRPLCEKVQAWVNGVRCAS